MQVNDDLTPPAFLRRVPTPESRARADAVVRQTINGARDWAPIRGPKQEETRVAKLDEVIVNRDAKVEVFRYPTDKPVGAEPDFVRNFDSADAFERWYSPPVHRCVGIKSDASMTTVLLEIQGDPNAAPKSSAPKGTVARIRTAGPKVEKPYDVDSRVNQNLRAAGFVKKANAAEEPLTFGRGDDEAVIVPPAKERKFSSQWILKLAGKPVAEGKGADAIKEALK